LTKEIEVERNSFFTFEWICQDPACCSDGQIHRKRVRSQSLEKARSVARTLGIPRDAKVIEEVEEKLRMRTLW